MAILSTRVSPLVIQILTNHSYSYSTFFSLFERHSNHKKNRYTDAKKCFHHLKTTTVNQALVASFYTIPLLRLLLILLFHAPTPEKTKMIFQRFKLVMRAASACSWLADLYTGEPRLLPNGIQLRLSSAPVRADALQAAAVLEAHSSGSSPAPPPPHAPDSALVVAAAAPAAQGKAAAVPRAPG